MEKPIPDTPCLDTLPVGSTENVREKEHMVHPSSLFSPRSVQTVTRLRQPTVTPAPPLPFPKTVTLSNNSGLAPQHECDELLLLGARGKTRSDNP